MIAPLHSSLDSKSETPSKKKKNPGPGEAGVMTWVGTMCLWLCPVVLSSQFPASLVSYSAQKDGVNLSVNNDFSFERA